MLEIKSFKKEKNSSGWFFDIGDLEVMVSGTDENPDADQVNKAGLILNQLDKVKSKAINLLENFMKDKGEWFLSGLIFGDEAKVQNCTFILEFGFVSSTNLHEYMYTGFQVCFLINETAPVALREPHPNKFIIGFS